MAIPHVFHPVKSSDFTITPVTVNKRYTLQRSELYSGSLPITSSGYKILTATYTNRDILLGTGRVYPTNSFDGTNQNILWKSIDSKYYRFGNDPYATLEHSNGRFTYKFLNTTASVVVIPQSYFGERVKAGSVQITSSLGINLSDDGYGNLYDVSISSASFSERHRLISRWDLDNQFINFPVDTGEGISDVVGYKSSLFEPQVSKIKNVDLSTGKYRLSNTGSQILGDGLWFDLNMNRTTGYVLTDDRPEYNLYGDFTIAFWSYISASQETTNPAIITKNGTVRRDTFGTSTLYKDTVSIQTNMISQSYFDESTNVYPLDFTYIPNDGKIKFTRSDGINNVSITSSIVSGSTKHISVTKSGSLLTMYVDGVSVGTTTDITNGAYNKHCLMFGARNQSESDYCRCLLRDIRIYDKAYSPNTITTLANSASLSTIQTSVVGNVFYRTGHIIVSSHNPVYNHIFDYDFTLRYRNTHTIYQWETIVRIPKGAFNLTQNRSALQNPYTDLLRNEFTGSNDDNTGLSPYITSVGLYNDRKELMAVAKLSQPVKKRSDVDLNIMVRWDT